MKLLFKNIPGANFNPRLVLFLHARALGVDFFYNTCGRPGGGFFTDRRSGPALLD
jgi:hypothetical protein